MMQCVASLGCCCQGNICHTSWNGCTPFTVTRKNSTAAYMLQSATTKHTMIAIKHAATHPQIKLSFDNVLHSQLPHQQIHRLSMCLFVSMLHPECMTEPESCSFCFLCHLLSGVCVCVCAFLLLSVFELRSVLSN